MDVGRQGLPELKKKNERITTSSTARGLRDPNTSSERIIEDLFTYVDAGTNNLIVALIMPEEERMDYLAKFSADVLPELQKMKTQ